MDSVDKLPNVDRVSNRRFDRAIGMVYLAKIQLDLALTHTLPNAVDA